METFINWVILAVGLIAIGIVFQLLLFAVKRCLHVKRRVQMLREYPNAEFKTVLVKLKSATRANKKEEIDEKIAEMTSQGWELFGKREAHPFQTVFSLGGGLTIDFVKHD
ncbi:MAG: hypothetical protein ABGZ53_00970 [Fuerstiella sp.]